MLAALSGFLLIGVIVAAGWGLRRWADLPANAETVLARVVWLVLNPCLLFTGVAGADLTALFSGPLLVSAGAALICFVLHPLSIKAAKRNPSDSRDQGQNARRGGEGGQAARRGGEGGRTARGGEGGGRPARGGGQPASGGAEDARDGEKGGGGASDGGKGEKTAQGTRIIGALSAGYVNANYIGIPIATYILGNAALVVPIIMLQLLVITPIALTLLDLSSTGRASLRDAVTTPLRNPMIVAVLLGAIVSLTGLHLPASLLNPLITIGNAAVPMVLIAFGMSLSGRRVLAPGPDRAATVTAVLLKSAAMPLFAVLLAAGLRLSPEETYAVTVLACLPTAQNVYLYGQRSGTGLVLARDTILLTTMLCAPVVLLATLLFTLR
ncbi:AEC family transporter [Actinoplanes oblitus]|uniref:AEC family transporter n=1 Tax=Actinoplanes oblitus TaxID=3040509 RepID=A0ABY8W8B8_9ACTN|nr:AEC family transporter [Actinoplanes oblitus]WIM93288.1 AEC family transporter [Actinoplanes oblitus]